jgi:hypothetical protein
MQGGREAGVAWLGKTHCPKPFQHPRHHPKPPPTHLPPTSQGLLRAALAKEVELAASVPGYRATNVRDRYAPVLADARLRGLAKLSESRKLIEKATGAVAALQSPADAAAAAQEAADMLSAIPATMPSAARRRPQALQPERPQGNPNIKDPIVVIIRHGKTEYNK